MIADCPKCHQLFEVVQIDAPAPRICPRCAAVDELLAAADALHEAIARRIERGSIAGTILRELTDRTGRAVMRARETR